MTCKDCDFWEKQSGTVPTGFCHRYPPRSVSVDMRLSAVYPLTYIKDWCGEETSRGKMKFEQYYDEGSNK